MLSLTLLSMVITSVMYGKPLPLSGALSRTYPRRLFTPALCSRFIYQLERAPGTGMLHLQGYLCTRNSSSYDVVRAYFKHVHKDAVPWITAAKQGAAAWDYCQKPDTRVAGPWQHGTPPAQGKRADLDDFAEACSALALGQRTVADLRTEFIHIDARYNRFFNQRIAAARPKRTKKTRVILCGGPAGTGKSHSCRQLSRSLFGVDPYPIMLREGFKGSTGSNWFDGKSSLDSSLLQYCLSLR